MPAQLLRYLRPDEVDGLGVAGGATCPARILARFVVAGVALRATSCRKVAGAGAFVGGCTSFAGAGAGFASLSSESEAGAPRITSGTPNIVTTLGGISRVSTSFVAELKVVGGRLACEATREVTDSQITPPKTNEPITAAPIRFTSCGCTMRHTSVPGSKFGTFRALANTVRKVCARTGIAAPMATVAACPTSEKS